jgi:hypothetical protein
MLDKRGKLTTVCGPPSPSDARLRRSQSLALGNGTALQISKELIRQKLDGQAALVREMLNDLQAAETIAKFGSELPSAENINAVRLIESQAAKTYWGSWADVPVRWPSKDERRIPEHWKRFGSRISPLTHSPRMATCPPNALLNFLYGLLESESRLSAAAMGLDPGIGLLHVEMPNRDSLACDIMEVTRPQCDAFVLHWLQSERLRRSDFWEDRNGNCRIVSSLAIRLCETADTWRRLVAPVAEWVAQALWNSSRKVANETKAVPTRLTQRHRSEGRGREVTLVANPPRLTKICEVCGGEGVKNRYCRSCAIEVARDTMARVALIGHSKPKSSKVKARISQTLSDHAVANTWWSPSSLPPWLNEDFYIQKIQPQLRTRKIREIAQAMKVSQPYAAFIRSGRRRPHPRHWQALARLAGVSVDA